MHRKENNADWDCLVVSAPIIMDSEQVMVSEITEYDEKEMDFKKTKTSFLLDVTPHFLILSNIKIKSAVK